MIPLKDENPTRTTPVVTVTIIVLNSLIFLFQLSLGRRGFDMMVASLGAVPSEIIHGMDIGPPTPIHPILTVFTAMFMHGGWLHIGGNMLYLWIFGNNIEDVLGHFRFILFYLGCGFVAAFAHILTSPGSRVPMVGASGAIAGVLGAYLLYFPRARVLTLVFFGWFIRVIRLPALFVLGFWFIIQVFNGLPSIGSRITGGVAWFAHIGGFVAGLAGAKILEFGRRRW